MEIAYSWIGGEIAIADVRQRAKDAGIIWTKYPWPGWDMIMMSAERVMSLNIIELIIRTGKMAASTNAYLAAKSASTNAYLAAKSASVIPLIAQKKMTGATDPAFDNFVFTSFLLRRPELNEAWMQESKAQADYLRSQIVIPSTTE
jgi:hypothetical protein